MPKQACYAVLGTAVEQSMEVLTHHNTFVYNNRNGAHAHTHHITGKSMSKDCHARTLVSTATRHAHQFQQIAACTASAYVWLCTQADLYVSPAQQYLV